MSYEKGIAEQLRRVANVYDLEVTFQDRSFQPTSTFKSCSTSGVLFKVTCSCYKKYIEETGRTI